MDFFCPLFSFHVRASLLPKTAGRTLLLRGTVGWLPLGSAAGSLDCQVHTKGINF